MNQSSRISIRIMRVLAFLFVLLFTQMPWDYDGGKAAAEGSKLIMGTSPDYPPYEDVDAKNGGEIIGLDIDIAKAITEKLGYELEIRSMDFNGLIAGLQTGRVDFVMSGMSVTEERKQSVDFSDSYYSARNTIVTLEDKPFKSMEELQGKRVGVQLGSTQEQAVTGLDAAITRLNKIPDLIQELKTGRIDAAIVEDAVAFEYAQNNSGLAVNYLPAGGDGYAIAFPKGSELTEAFNAELAEMKASGELDGIIKKWFPEEEEAGEGNDAFLDFSVLKGYIPFILKGVYVTLLFTIVSALFGFVWGFILTMFKLSKVGVLRWFATAYTSVFRGTPLLLQLTLIYFATPQLTGYDISALMSAGLAFGLNSAAYLSETIRGGILSVDKGQREAAMALGIPSRTTMVRIIMPQALRTILPALVNECVALIKESSLVSVIGVQDIMRRANIIQASEFRAFEPLLFAGVIYYVLVLVLTSLAKMLERRLRRSD